MIDLETIDFASWFFFLFLCFAVLLLHHYAVLKVSLTTYIALPALLLKPEI